MEANVDGHFPATRFTGLPLFGETIMSGCRIALCIVLLVVAACAAPLPLPEPPLQPVSVPSVPAHAGPDAMASESPAVPDGLPVIEYTIQAGAFSTPQRAADYADVLLQKGVDAYHFVDQDGLFKVRFERFATREAAHRRASWLRSQGLIETYYIVTPRESNVSENPQLSMRQNLVKTARRFIGTPYRWGGASPREGFDCSGLTMTVYRLNSLELPRSAREQFKVGNPIPREALKAGDLVFFATDGSGRVSHVGIYSGSGAFIHAPGKGKVISRTALANTYYNRRYLGARRYF